MRFALIISMLVSLSLPVWATAPEETASPTPTVAASPEASPAPTVASTPTPAAATTPDPMDPRYQIFYPYNGLEEEKRNPGGSWERGPYGKMKYIPPVRKPVVTTRPAATATVITTTTAQPTTVDVTSRVDVTVVGIAPESDVPAPRATTTTTTTTAPKKANTSWNWSWLWSVLKFLGYIVLLGAVAVGVWWMCRRWGRPAGATIGIAIAILAVLIWLNL